MNVARLVASVAGYFYSTSETEVAVHLYGGAETTLPVAGGQLTLKEASNYPWSGDITLTLDPQNCAPFTLSLRIPGWAKGATAAINGQPTPEKTDHGYLKITRLWAKGDTVTLTLPMPAERLYAHPDVRQDAGRVALRRGPLVYCVEQQDIAGPVQRLRLPADAALTDAWRADLLGGITTVTATAQLTDATTWGTALYRPTKAAASDSPLTAVPYYIWCNRGPNPMQVWLRE